jgi:tetratricopeptide (TPR) repeat protein
MVNLSLEANAAVQRGDLQTAEQRAKRYHDIARETKGEYSVEFADALHIVGVVDIMAGRIAGAKANLNRALAIYEKLDPPDKQRIAAMLPALAVIYGRPDEEIKALRTRWLTRLMSELRDSDESDLKPLLVRLTERDINNPAHFDETERIFKTMIERVGDARGDHGSAVIWRITLASLYAMHNRCEDAEPILREADQTAVTPFERMRAKECLARCAQSRSDFAEAERLYKAAIAQPEYEFGPFPLYIDNLVSLSDVYLGTNRPAEALEAARRLAEAIRRSEFSAHAEASAIRFAFDQQIVAAWAMSRTPGAREESLLREAFEAAQWSARNKAGEALSLFGARLMEAGAQKSSQIRRLQDAREDWQRLDRAFFSALVADDSAKLADVRQRIEVATETLREAESVLPREAPDFAALTSIETTSMSEARALLKPSRHSSFLPPPPKEVLRSY